MPLLVNLAVVFPQPTGIATYSLNLVPHLQRLNPTVISAQPLNGLQVIPCPADMTPVFGTRGHIKRLLWTQMQVPKLYRKLGSSLLFSPLPEAPLGQACRTVVMVHDLIPLRFPRQWHPITPYWRTYVPAVLHQAKHLICNSLATAEDLMRFYGLPARKITPIPLAYDAEHFRWLDLPPRNYFLYLGRTAPYKNVRRLLAAFAQGSQDTELWIAGPADRRYTPSLQLQADQLGVGARVKFLNYVDYAALPSLLNQAIALVFPSLWEGFGLPVLEAMACGTPVITSNRSSLPEVIGDAGLLVDPEQVGEIADAMRAIECDLHLRNTLRIKGLNRAQQFSWLKTGQATATLLETLI